MGTKPKIRNYSFKNSKRIPEDKMTVVNGIKIPSLPGSCYHAIMCVLAERKDSFCSWSKIYESTEQKIKMYGGQTAWDKFVDKNGSKTANERIKENTYMLTRSGNNCYGRRLHERGITLYYFKDGAMMVTGGVICEDPDDGTKYDVFFPDGRRLQKRYRGTTMTYKEYCLFLENGWINISGSLLNHSAIQEYRTQLSKYTVDTDQERLQKVRIKLDEGYDQNTALRFQELGLFVDEALEEFEIIGTISSNKLRDLEADEDVLSVCILD